ncbi:MAG: ATP-grasp domain-containing protein [Verrucomicrobiales bacterium]
MLIHRGWMMSDELYLQLWSELERKGYSLFTKPAGYAEAHYLPNAYKHINGLTPASAWVVGNSLEAAWDIYQQFKDGPALVKDFVKSAKHRWNEACFIPAKASREHFKQIMASFLEARGDQFNKGIVLRRFHTLVTLQRDLRGQPVHEEYRMFFFGGKLFAATPPLQGEGPFGELAKWTDIANRFESKFISMDVARQEDGAWVIIEVGDGGVSGLPDSIDSKFFYLKLRTFTDECKS